MKKGCIALVLFLIGLVLICWENTCLGLVFMILFGCVVVYKKNDGGNHGNNNHRNSRIQSSWWWWYNNNQ